MSILVPCISCDGGWTTLKQLFKGLIYEDSDGNQYFNIKFIPCGAQDSPAVTCGGNVTLEQLIKGSIVVNDCDQCALLVGIDQGSMDLICDNCTPR